MTPSEFARAELSAILKKAKASSVDEQAALRALLDAAASALLERSNAEDVQNELSFIARNLLGDEEDYSFMRP